MTDEVERTDTYDESLNLVDVDSSQIYADVVSGLESAVGEPLYPGDERRIFGEALVAAMVAYVSKANDASKQTLLRFARGQVLDAMGERLGVKRIAATPARCTLKFTLSAPQHRAITIPAMTRVTSDGVIYFATDAPCAIGAGETTGEVAASCTEAGSIGNGIARGALSTLVDLQPYVETVANTGETAGGDDGEPYTAEGDGRLRERVKLAPNALSVAGPEQAYIYHAMSADPGIVDVAAFSEEFTDSRKIKVEGGKVHMGGDLLHPEKLLTVNGQTENFEYEYKDSLLTITLSEPLSGKGEVEVKVDRTMDGRVKIVPLMAGGKAPGSDVIAAVSKAVGARGVRPMTDVVTVEAPKPVEYEIDVRYWTTVEDEARVVEAVEGAGGAVDRYVADQCAVLGRSINPDVLKTYIMQAGAIRCDVTKPAYATVSGTQVAKLKGDAALNHELETTAGWGE